MKTEPQVSELSAILPNKLVALRAPSTLFESKLSSLYVFLNTMEGERIYNSSFGVDWVNLLSEQQINNDTDILEYNITNILNEKAREFFPQFRVTSVEIVENSSVYQEDAGAVVMATWIYDNKFTFKSITMVKWNEQFGTQLTEVNKYDKNSQESVSTGIIMNIINTLRSQLNNNGNN